MQAAPHKPSSDFFADAFHDGVFLHGVLVRALGEAQRTRRNLLVRLESRARDALERLPDHLLVVRVTDAGVWLAGFAIGAEHQACLSREFVAAGGQDARAGGFRCARAAVLLLHDA